MATIKFELRNMEESRGGSVVVSVSQMIRKAGHYTQRDCQEAEANP